MGISLFLRGGKDLLEREAIKEIYKEYMEGMANIMKEDEDAPFNLGPAGSWLEPKTIPVGLSISFGMLSGIQYPPVEWKQETADATVLLANKRLYIFILWTQRKIRGKQIKTIFVGLPHYDIKNIKIKESKVFNEARLIVEYNGFHIMDSSNRAKSARFWMVFSKKKDIDYLGQKVNAAQMMGAWFELLMNQAKREKYDVDGIVVKEDIDL